ERRPLRPSGMAHEPHPCLRGRTAALQAVAPMTRADDVFPHRRAALRARHDMVEIQLGTRELAAAVLTAILVPCVDVETTEPYVTARNTIVPLEQDHPRHTNGSVDEPDPVLLDGEIGPALEIKRPVVLVHRACDVLVEQREGPSHHGDVDW